MFHDLGARVGRGVCLFAGLAVGCTLDGTIGILGLGTGGGSSGTEVGGASARLSGGSSSRGTEAGAAGDDSGGMGAGGASIVAQTGGSSSGGQETARAGTAGDDSSGPSAGGALIIAQGGSGAAGSPANGGSSNQQNELGGTSGSGKGGTAAAGGACANEGCLIQACEAPIFFDNLPTFQTGDDPAWVVAGDWNRDGNLDIATANTNANSVSVLLGKGDGSFLPKRDSDSGVGPFFALAADWNSDGQLDLMTLNGTADAKTFSVLLGNGDGTFQAIPEHTISSSVVGAASADWNGDGKPDLAILTNNSSWDAPASGTDSISVLLGDGNGTFTAGQEYLVPYYPGAVVASDMNGDSKPDLVVIAVGGLRVLFSNGDGSFTYPADIQTDTFGEIVATGDFDQDGARDVAAISDYCDYINSSDRFVSALGDGQGNFNRVEGDAAGVCFASLAAGDANGDGRPDLITSKGLVLLGNGDGTFKSLPNGSADVTGSSSLALGDWNNDGKLDRATVNGPLDLVAVRLGNGDGTFGSRVDFRGQQLAALADVNGDGALDALTTDVDTNTVGVLLGDGHGSLSEAQFYPAGYYPYEPHVGDLNGDGMADIIVKTGTTVSALLGNRDGSLSAPQDCLVARSPDDGGGTVLLGDVTGDGKLDIVLSGYGYQFAVLIGNGDGTFAEPLEPAFDSNLFLTGMADLNNDGKLDLVAGDFNFDTVVLLSVGDGTFRISYSEHFDLAAGYLQTGDFNEDGHLDLVLSNGPPNETMRGAVLFGNGDGTFAKGTAFAMAGVGADFATVASGDFNGDGHGDLVVVGESIHVLLGAGDGTFRCVQTVIGVTPVNLTKRAVVAGDLNGDHKLDLALYTGADNHETVSVFLSPF